MTTDPSPSDDWKTNTPDSLDQSEDVHPTADTNVAPHDGSVSPSSSRTSLTSSYNSDSAEQNAIKLLHAEDSTPRVKRIRSIRDQIADDNRSIVEEERASKNDLEQRLKREFSIEDALKVTRLTSRASSHQKDEEIPVETERQMSTVEKVFTNLTTGAVDLPPDGGYGWVCCLCAFFILFSTWGNNSAFGVYLAYYIDNDVFEGATRMDFAWIAGLIVFMGQFFSPFAMISDRMLGFKMTMGIAVCVHFLGYLLASFATQLWQLYVCQGVVVGMTYSFLVAPACTIIPNWFLKKRAIASGILCGGTGLGGLMYSLSINAMIQRTGDQRWSLRMVAITTTVTMSIAVFFIRRRNDGPRIRINPTNVVTTFKVMFSPKVLRNPRLWYISLWFALALLGYNLTLFSYASAATAMGISQHNASTLTAVINAAQAVGRPSMGIVADTWVGRVNYTMLLNLIVVVVIFCFWIFARSFTALVICGALLGLILGVGNVMNSVLIADAFVPEEFAPAWSILNLIIAFFLLFVEVIALSLRDDSLANPFFHAQIFAGASFVVAVLFLIPIREWHIKNHLEKRQMVAQQDQERISGRKILGIEVDPEEEESTEMMLRNYENLLQSTPKGFLKRAFYPVKV